MRYGLRAFRTIASGIVVLVLAVGTVGYVVYAANGLLDQVAARNTREEHNGVIAGTATALAQRLAVVSVYRAEDNPVIDGEDAVQPTHEAALVQIEATPTETALPTSTPEPTATPSPTDPPSATLEPPTVTLIPTNTPRVTMTAIPTNTPRPSLTPTASDTPLPSATPTATATLTPSITPTPTATYTPTIEPSPTYIIEGTYAVPLQTPIVELPERVPLMEDGDDIVNFLLLGSDTSGGHIRQVLFIRVIIRNWYVDIKVKPDSL